jgi:hypothetical protein
MLLRARGLVIPYDSTITIEAIVVFLHIEKTAGMSIRRLLFDIYGRDEVLEILYMSSSYLQDISFKYRAICGHFHANSHIYDQLRNPFVHFTVLRDPVERVLSEYYYYREQPKHARLYNLANKYSLEELLKQESKDFFPIFNWMCYHLSGILPQTSPLSLDCAKHTLCQDMTFFGFSHNLKELAQIGRRLLGWTPVEIHHVNQTMHKIRPSNYLVSLIIEQNQLDIELYKFAKEIYKERRLNWLR